MMYDRVLRSELFESNRYLDLHSDTSRLAWLSLLPLADDFGNLAGDSRRLWRWLSTRTTLKTEADVVKVLSELCDADLLRRYEVGSDPYFHIPRFRQTRDYVRRLVPASQWDDPGLAERMVDIKARRLASWHARKSALTDSQDKSKTVSPTVAERSLNVDPLTVTGVGVGVGTKEKKETGAHSEKASRLSRDWSLPAHWLSWALDFANDQGRPVQPEQVHLVADSFRDYWTAKAGRDASKLDWLATWRRWFRTEYTDGRLSRLPAEPDQAAMLRRAK